MQQNPKTKEILKGKISFISLCRTGKNRVQAIYKAEDGGDALTVDSVAKASENFDEEGLLYACVYPPNKVDDDGHWAAPETVRDMAHEALRTGVKLDIFHDEHPLSPDRAAIVESTIIQKGDARFGDPAELSGGWGVVIKLIDPDLRKRYREEGWGGVSMGGEALTKESPPPEQVSKSSILSSLVRRISNLFGADAEPISLNSPSGTYRITINKQAKS